MRAVHLFVMDTEAQPTPWGLEPLIDVGELAAYLGILVSTIYDWRGLSPPAYRFGEYLKFAVSDVRDWILYTDETSSFRSTAGSPLSESKAAIEAGAEPSYSGAFVGARRYILDTFANTKSASLKRHGAQFLTAAICPVCQGKRLKPEALIKSLVAVPRRPPRRMCDSQMCPSPEKRAATVELASGVSQRLRQLVDLRLGYLTLSRTTPTLSGGELQRLRLATQLSSDLFRLVYVLDEPSARGYIRRMWRCPSESWTDSRGEGTACSSSNTPWL